jgi:hypothetical protein
MSREENPTEKDLHDLSELETALAALVPRADRLNRDRLMFLAGQASMETKIGQPAVGQITNQPNVRQPHVPSAWPVAFAAMTGIAAALLVALAIRPGPQIPGPQIVERIVKVPAAQQEPIASQEPIAPQDPSAAIVQGSAEPDSTVDSALNSTVDSTVDSPDFVPHSFIVRDEPSNADLRRQRLLHGLEPWRLRTYDSTAASRTVEEPVLDRQQLNRWLEQEGVEGVLRRLSTPTLRIPAGARS